MKTTKQTIGTALVAMAIMAMSTYSCSGSGSGGGGGKSSKEPSMTITTEKAVGETIRLGIRAVENDTFGVWIDLNNNKVKDQGEEIDAQMQKDFFVEYPVASQTFTIYGNVVRFNAAVMKISTLDVSNNPALEELTMTTNNLKKLDLGKNVNLKELRIQYNPLGQLEVTNKPELESIDCESCQLTSLKIKDTPNLREINIMDNTLNDKAIRALIEGLHVYEGRLKSNMTIRYDNDSEKNDVPSQATIDLAKSKNWTMKESTSSGEVEY